jgi:anti-sigma28 factor (negative regulator of flagellin synthesis)
MEASQLERSVNEMKNRNAGQPVPSGLQLAKLSSVLNGLEHGVSAMQQHVSQAMAAIKAGTYKVDASAVSRLLISESLGSKMPSTEQR